MAAAWWIPLLLLGPTVEVYAISPQALVQSVVASGHVEAAHRATIGSQIIASVRRIPVAEGQRVEAGEVLLGWRTPSWGLPRRRPARQ